MLTKHFAENSGWVLSFLALLSSHTLFSVPDATAGSFGPADDPALGYHQSCARWVASLALGSLALD